MSFPAYEDYKDSGFDWLGMLPSHWEAVPNKVAFWRVKTEVGDEWSNTQLLSLTLRGVVVRDIDSGDGKYPADFSNYQIVEPDDMVFCLFDMDETPRTVGLSKNRGMITSAYDVFRCNPHVDPAFVCYFYHHVDSHKGLRPFYTGLRKTVRTPTFLSIKMPVPPLYEQKAISSFLDVETSKIDALVSEQRRLIELLKEKRQAVISHAVTKGLNPNAPMKPSGILWLGNVPEHWKVIPMKRGITNISQGYSPQCHNEPAPEDEWGVVKVGCCNGFDLNEQEQKALPPEIEPIPEYEIQHGDILMSRGNTPDLVGSACLVQNVRPRLLLCDLVYRFRTIEDFFNPAFLVHSLRAKNVRSQIECNAVGTSSTMKKVSQELARNLVVCRPPLEEQEEIVDRLTEQVETFSQLQAEAQRAIELLQERRTALISAAVTGKIDVRSFGKQGA